ncbi:MAG: hypothetical protein KDC67_07480, partial [Ignavibacteriae bacterium]|nr:hypothetical protein [Ignavibacteriota bacterium]
REKFGFPTEMAKDAIGIKSYNTYIKTLNDLVDWGFIKMIERSKNQYSSNIIALSYFDKALDKALDKAITKHLTKQSESTCESNDSINKPKTIKPKTSNIKEDEEDVLFTIDKLKERYLSDEDLVSAVSQTLNTNHGEIEKKLTTFNEHLKSTGINSKKWLDYTSHFLNWYRINNNQKKVSSPFDNLSF